MRKYIKLKLSILSLLFILILTACGADNKEARFDEYTKHWQAQEFEEMYKMLSESSKSRISEEDFVGRYTTIYEAIDAEEIEIAKNETDDEVTGDESFKFNVKMNTFLGELALDTYYVALIKEEQGETEDWFIEWDESLIFPQMTGEDEVRIATTEAKRGEIYDREGNPLAINGIRYNLGIHPARFDETNIAKVATDLDIDEELIQEKLDANTNPEYFVPLVKIATDEEELIAKLLEIEGIISQEVDARVYPAGEAFGALIGYINPITKEELDESEEGAYTATSLIGKAGIEKVYETELRPNDGKEIYISKIEGDEEVERISLANSEAKDGNDLHLSIDSGLQNKIYAEGSDDVGTASAVHPKTGEVLALVSFPSYDPNFYTSYTPNAQKETWENMEASVFDNRFNKAYSPGSAFKVVTAAIGLEKGTIEPKQKMRIEGKGWQKDQSWGNYKVNRVSQKLSQVNLEEAFIYSDNIYFAQSALKIGAKNFIEKADDFGFDEELPLKYPFAKSQIANDNRIDEEILLADTGYGQGEVLMSSLHLSLVYSSLVNDGNIMNPTLKKSEEDTIVWKEDVLAEEYRQTLLDSLIATIENPDGTGRTVRVEGIKLAGKTGTAEFKGSQEAIGRENGWFVGLNVDEPEIVLSMMIEDVQDRGGSNYTAGKVRDIFIDYFEEN